MAKPDKLNYELAQEIKKEYYTSLITQKELANKYEVHPNTISRIIRRIAYMDKDKCRIKLNEVQRINIYIEYNSTYITQEKLAEKYGVSNTTISDVLKSFKKTLQK